jgi:hypothetical protein
VIYISDYSLYIQAGFADFIRILHTVANKETYTIGVGEPEPHHFGEAEDRNNMWLWLRSCGDVSKLTLGNVYTVNVVNLSNLQH